MAANDELVREYLESAGDCCNPATRPVHPSCFAQYKCSYNILLQLYKWCFLTSFTSFVC